MSPAEQRAADQQTCAGYGYRPGTNAFADCMMMTAQQRQAQRDRMSGERERMVADQERRARGFGAPAPGPVSPAPWGGARVQPVSAGPIWNNMDAQRKCPAVCSQQGAQWDGNWRTVAAGRDSTCDCRR